MGSGPVYELGNAGPVYPEEGLFLLPWPKTLPRMDVDAEEEGLPEGLPHCVGLVAAALAQFLPQYACITLPCINFGFW